jgi:hypothetical protein
VKIHELTGPPEPTLLVAGIALRDELAQADRVNAALWENRRDELYGRAGTRVPAQDAAGPP